MFVEGIYVDMQYRRKGIGQAMIKAVLEWGNRNRAPIAFLCATQVKTAPDAARGEDPEAEDLYNAIDLDQLHWQDRSDFEGLEYRTGSGIRLFLIHQTGLRKRTSMPIDVS